MNAIKVARVLSIIKSGPVDAQGIANIYEARHDKTIWLSTVYSILRALEREEIIRGEYIDGTDTPERGGNRRRMYDFVKERMIP